MSPTTSIHIKANFHVFKRIFEECAKAFNPLKLKCSECCNQALLKIDHHVLELMHMRRNKHLTALVLALGVLVLASTTIQKWQAKKENCLLLFEIRLFLTLVYYTQLRVTNLHVFLALNLTKKILKRKQN